MLRNKRTWALLVVIAAVGCADDDAGVTDAHVADVDAMLTPATIEIAFSNNTPTAPFWHEYNGNETPDDFAVKLIAVSLAESTDPEAPQDKQLIYLNPACIDVAGCAVVAGPGVTAVVNDYLEIQRPSADVNIGLAATQYQVRPSSYGVVEMLWSREYAEGFNGRYRMNEWTAGATKELVWGEFEFSHATLSGPVVIPPGASLLLTLHYNLEGMVEHGQSIDGCAPTNDPTCHDEGIDRWFLNTEQNFSGTLSEISP